MEAAQGLRHRVTHWLQLHWQVLSTAIGYYASMRVIFYTELALIILCSMDLMQNATLLTIMVTRRGNYALMYTGWAVDEESYINANSWDEALILALGLYLLESLIRIYYCLKLAYYHNCKASEGDLCCMKCHQVLMLAAMSSVFVVPHFLSGLFIIVFFITCHAETATRTVNFHKDYFRHSPFIRLPLNRSSSVMAQSMFYRMGERIMTTLKDCRLDTGASIGASTEALLQTGQLLSMVSLDCAVERMHCRHGKYYLQLAIESVQVLINYTVIRCLFSHVIHLHQYEVYNLQTRLQTRGSSRIIRVYRMSRRRAHQRSGRLSNMPRQALISLINIGSNVAARFRTSRDSKSMSDSPDDPRDSVGDSPAEQSSLLYTAAAADSDVETCSVGNESQRTIGEPDDDDPDCGEGASGSEPRQNQQQQPPQPVYNRKSANTRKVDYEHLKISDLYPAALAGDNKEDSKTAATAVAASAKPRTPLSSVTGPATARQARGGGARYNSHRKVNDSIFTDETFYSLDT